MAQTKPTSEELRAELKGLRSTATRLIEQASRLKERCAELEDQNVSRNAKAHEIMTIAHRPSTRAIAFVEMTQATEAQSAISALDGTMLNGRAMNVNEARPKLHRDPIRDSGRRDHRQHRM